jgi:hypothetical protein
MIDPLSDDGRVWYGALKQVASREGWLTTWWGFVDQSDEVFMIIGKATTMQGMMLAGIDIWSVEWSSASKMAEFIAADQGTGLPAFLEALGSLLVPAAEQTTADSLAQSHLTHWQTLAPPNLGFLEPSPLAVSVVYQLNFQRPMNEDKREGLRIDLQLFRSFLHQSSQDAAEKDEEVSFNGIDGFWISTKDSPNSSNVSQVETFLLVFSWANERSERAILDSGEIKLANGSTVTHGGFLEQEIFGRADLGVQRRQVAFEHLFSGNLDLTAKEAYSTYLKKYSWESSMQPEAVLEQVGPSFQFMHIIIIVGMSAIRHMSLGIQALCDATILSHRDQ